MRKIELATVFRRDYKREGRGRHRHSLDAELAATLEALASDMTLDAQLRIMRSPANGPAIANATSGPTCR
jgi:hypothetical protein